MPTYLRFVKGVVDSADLPLNVSRELLQESRDVKAIREGNTRRVLSMLEDLAKHDVPAADASDDDKKDAGKFSKFYAEFGAVLKEGLGEDFANKDKIAKLLRFASTTSDTVNVGFADYKTRMKEGQEAIYYVTADSLAAAKNSPQLEVFRKKGIEVLLMSDRVDEWALGFLNEFDGTPLQSVAKGAFDLGKLQDEDEKKAAEAEAKQAEYEAGRTACEERRNPTKCLANLEKNLPVASRTVEPFETHLPPERDVASETLAGALDGSILVHVHCYRSDDMGSMLALADEVGFKVTSFHHALEAYKMRGELARRDIAVSTWADWFGFKLEAYDGIPENLALIHTGGGSAVVHTDSAEGVRRLNQEAAKGMWSGRNAGLEIKEADAIRWVTSNPAKALGVDRWVGTLEAGKDADVVVWSGNPFSVYTKAELVFVDGIVRHDAKTPTKPWSDFEVKP